MKAFAWISFVLALVAGAGLAAHDSNLVLLIIALAAITVLILDIAKDRIPNQGAVIVAVALPSLLVGMSGRFATTVSGWFADLWDFVAGWAGAWAGTASTISIAAGAITVSFLIARRAVPKFGGGR